MLRYQSAFSPSGEHHALPGSRVVEEYLQHRLTEQAALAPSVDEHKKPVDEQPAQQVKAVEVDRQPKREPRGFSRLRPQPAEVLRGPWVLEAGASFTRLPLDRGETISLRSYRSWA
jgi:hypothetical protein